MVCVAYLVHRRQTAHSLVQRVVQRGRGARRNYQTGKYILGGHTAAVEAGVHLVARGDDAAFEGQPCVEAARVGVREGGGEALPAQVDVA